MPATETVRTPIPFDAAIFTGLEATDPVLDGDVERVEVGPLFGRYCILEGPDLVVAADELIELLRKVQDVVMDARQEAVEAERQTCHYCGAPHSVEPGMDTCGRADCERRFSAEVYADLVLGGI